MVGGEHLDVLPSHLEQGALGVENFEKAELAGAVAEVGGFESLFGGGQDLLLKGPGTDGGGAQVPVARS